MIEEFIDISFSSKCIPFVNLREKIHIKRLQMTWRTNRANWGKCKKALEAFFRKNETMDWEAEGQQKYKKTTSGQNKIFFSGDKNINC